MERISEESQRIYKYAMSMNKFPVVGIGSPPPNTQAANTAVMAVMEDVSQLLMANAYPDLFGSESNWPP